MSPEPMQASTNDHLHPAGLVDTHRDAIVQARSVFKVTSTCIRVEKACCDIKSYIAQCSGAAPNSVTHTLSVPCGP